MTRAYPTAAAAFRNSTPSAEMLPADPISCAEAVHAHAAEDRIQVPTSDQHHATPRLSQRATRRSHILGIPSPETERSPIGRVKGVISQFQKMAYDPFSVPVASFVGEKKRARSHKLVAGAISLLERDHEQIPRPECQAMETRGALSGDRCPGRLRVRPFRLAATRRHVPMPERSAGSR